jgi:hypothetical protein
MSNITKRNTSLAKRDTGDVTEKQRKVTSLTPKNQDMVIADLSGSMSYTAFEGKSRYDCLQEALAPYLGRVQVLAFNNYVREVDADSLPQPAGFTAMDKAFKVATYLEPLKVLLISDGCPDNKGRAIDEATTLAKDRTIDVMYIGPRNEVAEKFMQQIADIGGGRYFNFEIDKNSPALLESKIGTLLALPSPGSIEL